MVPGVGLKDSALGALLNKCAIGTRSVSFIFAFRLEAWIYIPIVYWLFAVIVTRVLFLSIIAPFSPACSNEIERGLDTICKIVDYCF